jgi:hypothetical protein
VWKQLKLQTLNFGLIQLALIRILASNHRKNLTLTVALVFAQSEKKAEAENFFLMTTVDPKISIWPIDMHPAAVWYNGSGL